MKIDDLANESLSPGKYGSIPDLPYIREEFDYGEYLNSERWQRIRMIILEKYNYKCYYCGSYNDLQVHHFSYKNFGDEENHLEDLRLLCKNCHKRTHNIK